MADGIIMTSVPHSPQQFLQLYVSTQYWLTQERGNPLYNVISDFIPPALEGLSIQLIYYFQSFSFHAIQNLRFSDIITPRLLTFLFRFVIKCLHFLLSDLNVISETL